MAYKLALVHSAIVTKLLLVLSVCSTLASETVTIPITIDYTLLETLLTSRVFSEPGDSATLIDHGDGCISLTLSSPHITESDGSIILDTEISTRVGTPFGDTCFSPLEWQGFLQFQQQLFLVPNSWEIGFKTVDTTLTGSDRNPPEIANLLLDLIESHAIDHFDSVTLDLAPPVGDLKQFLLPLFPDETRKSTEKMLGSMRAGALTVSDSSILFEILADVDEIYQAPEDAGGTQLSPEARDNLISLWENWDALLSYLVITISQKTLSEAEQQLLIDTLLETRYRFVQELNDNTISHDIVRKQFIAAWQQLSPIFKNHLYQDLDSHHALGYLAFVSASDALLVLDRLGPTFGLEISTDGLVRLMEMLNGDPAFLFSRPEVNPELQKLFQLEPKSSEEQIDLPPSSPDLENQDQSAFHRFMFELSRFLEVPMVHAAEQPTFQEILKWKVPSNNLQQYIDRVDALLERSIGVVSRDKNIPDTVQPMYSFLIPAMAWQESCYRQFIVKDKKLQYLLSYNGSSVGLMQINERVWRGIYNRNLLRWDIEYNARAGCEIAALYLKKYVLNSSEKLSEDAMARAVYAIYNGGPSHYRKFLKRLSSGNLYLSDTLFWEKYRWIVDGETDKVSSCLSGG